MIINSEQEMLNFGHKFANLVTEQMTTLKRNLHQQDPSRALVIELIGDVGTGKTTFTRGLAESLGVKEPVTSPSFTISKVYALPNGKQLIHYDFYRLPDPGLMLEDLTESINNPNAIVIIEWAESVSDLLPEDRITIKINYTDSGREIII